MTAQSNIEEQLKQIAHEFIINFGIHVQYYLDYLEDKFFFSLNKDGKHLRFFISRYEIKDSLYVKIIYDHVNRFLDQIKDSNPVDQTVLNAMTRKSISISGKDSSIILVDDIKIEDGIMKRTNGTLMFTDQDRKDINRLKEAASGAGLLLPEHIIAGGFFSSIYWNEQPKDIDFFFLDKQKQSLIQNIDNIKKHNVEYLKNPMIENVVSVNGTKNQFIYTKYKTRKELIDHFDMMHCCVSYDSSEDKLYISPAALHAIKTKTIIPNGNKKIAQWRIDKMIQRGWKLETVSV